MVYGLKYRTLSALTAWLPLLPAALCSLAVIILYHRCATISIGRMNIIAQLYSCIFIVAQRCNIGYNTDMLEEV